MRPRNMTDEQLISILRSDRCDRSTFAQVYLQREGYGVSLNYLKDATQPRCTYDVRYPNELHTRRGYSAEELVEIAMKEVDRG